MSLLPFSKYQGESEKYISNLFAEAKKYPRAVIFFDEFDSIAAARGGKMEDCSMHRRLLAELLLQLSLHSQNYSSKQKTPAVGSAASSSYNKHSSTVTPSNSHCSMPTPAAEVVGETNEATSTSCAVSNSTSSSSTSSSSSSSVRVPPAGTNNLPSQQHQRHSVLTSSTSSLAVAAEPTMSSSTTVTATATTSARSQQQQQQQQQQAVEQVEDHALVVVAATNRCAERINIALPDSTGWW